MINIFQPALGVEELEAVRRVFTSNWTGKGRLTDRFESEFAAYLKTDRQEVRSVSCCTEGIFQAIKLLGLKSTDEVILPSISFVGAANAAAAQGCVPVFCDVDKRTLNATAELIEKKITPKTKAVILIHYGGFPCEMEPIQRLLEKKKIALIEDSACSVASSYRGKACGTLGDIGVWSFDSMKILVTGDGGMIWCRNGEMARLAEESVYLGLRSQSGFANKTADKWWQFEIGSFGRRAIMNDIASAIGLEQLKKLEGFIARRRQIHAAYDEALACVEELKLPPALPKDCESSYYFYWIQTLPQKRDALAQFLKENGVYSTFRYYPLHLVSLYASSDSLPNAEEAAHSTLCIPMHQSLSDADVEKVFGTILRFFGK